MVAKSQPVAIASQVKQESDIERLRKLRDKLRRLLAGAARTNEEIYEIEQRLEREAA